MFTEISKDIKKQTSALEATEALILRCKRRIEINNSKKYKLDMYSKKLLSIFKIIYFLDNLYLNLLRNNLYRILNKSVIDSKVRKLVKLEILKAPEGTFSDFVKLYNDLKEEISKSSRKECGNSNYPLN